MLRDPSHSPPILPDVTEPMRASIAAKFRPRAPSPVTLFVQEPVTRRARGLRVGVICDGTSRGGPNGMAEGAARVIECAEHAAARGDVELFVAFILSPQNLTRRATPFFAALHAELLRLLDAVLEGRALVGIRVEVEGRLHRLRRKGGAAARLADTVALLAEVTADRSNPRAVLALGVDYEERAPIARGLDVLVRTGMEEARVLRLSGLTVRKETACIPSPLLWRQFTPDDLDDALARAPKAPRVEPRRGLSRDLVRGLADGLSRIDLATPVRLLVPVDGPAERALAALRASLRAAPIASVSSKRTTGVAVTAGGSARLHIGPEGARVTIRLFDRQRASFPRGAQPIAWIAPGQTAASLHLFGRSARDANIHVCEPTARGLVEGVREALRFHQEHPQLHGAPRPRASIEPARAREDEGPTSPHEAIGRAFTMKSLAWLEGSGLVSGDVDWRRQAFGYAMTAFAIAFDPRVSSDWEPAAIDLCRAMLVMASSDEEITDRAFEGEDPRARRERLEISVAYLSAILRGEDPPPPHVDGARVLSAIAGAWRDLLHRRAEAAHPAILSAARRASLDLYAANLEEITRADPLFDAIARAARRGTIDEAALEIASRGAPEPCARRLLDLTSSAKEGDLRAAALREARLLCRLRRAAPSIGAGCAFLWMASTEPREAVPESGAARLIRAVPLIDHAFRLENDLAFTDATRGDRDDKPNAFTCLVPSRLRGMERERAAQEALSTCRAARSFFAAEIERSAADLAESWPVAAGWLARGMHVGRRAYQAAHYDRLTPSAISAIVEGALPKRLAPHER